MAQNPHPDDSPDLDLHNYKGQYAEEDSEEKYTCPLTGAHFAYRVTLPLFNLKGPLSPAIQDQNQPRNFERGL